MDCNNLLFHVDIFKIDSKGLADAKPQSVKEAIEQVIPITQDAAVIYDGLQLFYLFG